MLDVAGGLLNQRTEALDVPVLLVLVASVSHKGC